MLGVCELCDDLYRHQASILLPGDFERHREVWWLHIDAEHPGWNLPIPDSLDLTPTPRNTP